MCSSYLHAFDTVSQCPTSELRSFLLLSRDVAEPSQDELGEEVARIARVASLLPAGQQLGWWLQQKPHRYCPRFCRLCRSRYLAQARSLEPVPFSIKTTIEGKGFETSNEDGRGRSCKRMVVVPTVMVQYSRVQ